MGELSDTDKQVFIEFYKVQWNVIDKLDKLDWRVALIFIPLVGAFAGVLGILSQWVPHGIETYTQSIKAFAFIVFLFCLYGLWTVVKGQSHSMLRFRMLRKIEKKLSLHSYVFTRPQKYRFSRVWPAIVCRRFLLFFVYLGLGILAFSMAVIPVNRWDFSALQNPIVLVVPPGLAIIITLVHFYDHKLHLEQQESKGNSVDQKKPKFEIKDVVLSLWSVVLAFIVQVLYDIFGQDFYTDLMPKVWWGVIISIFLSILLLVYMKRLKSK